jgi:alpha-tubulin suppressor-like RCC1 family protein
VAYLVRCARQRRCREAPHIAAGFHSLFAGAAGRVLACPSNGGHGGAGRYCIPMPMAAMAGIRVRSVSAGDYHSLALDWDGRVYAWGENNFGQLGVGSRLLHGPVPALVEGLGGVREVAAAGGHSLAVTQSGDVFRWGFALLNTERNELRPIGVEGFPGVRVRGLGAGRWAASAIGEAGELSSWGQGDRSTLGHGDAQDQAAPKRVPRALEQRPCEQRLNRKLPCARAG